MSQLTLLLLRFGLLLILWVFVFAIVYSLRSDLFGQRVRKQPAPPANNSPFVASAIAPAVVPAAVVPAVVPAAVVPAAAPSSRPPAPSTQPVSSGASGRSGDATSTSVLATRLVITSGPKEGLELSLPNEPLTIGRSSESGLVIRDDYTSTHHARLMRWDESWVVQDLDSTNGTFLDGTRVTLPTPVPLNTPVRIGTTSFELRR